MDDTQSLLHSSPLYSSDVALHLELGENILQLGAVNRLTATLHPHEKNLVNIDDFLRTICTLVISVDGKKRRQNIRLENYRPDLYQFEFSLAS